MKVIDIVFQVIKQRPDNINKFVSSFKSAGHTFERTFDLMNRTGNSPFCSYSSFYGCFGNKNFISSKKIGAQSFLSEKINNGNSHGPVDLLLVNEAEKKSIALTFKFFNDGKPKSFFRYDVGKMMTSPKEDILSQFKDHNLYFGIVSNSESIQLNSMLYKSKSKDSEKVKIVVGNPELNDYFNSFVLKLYKNVSQSTKDDITKERILSFFESKKSEK